MSTPEVVTAPIVITRTIEALPTAPACITKDAVTSAKGLVVARKTVYISARKTMNEAKLSLSEATLLRRICEAGKTAKLGVFEREFRSATLAFGLKFWEECTFEYFLQLIKERAERDLPLFAKEIISFVDVMTKRYKDVQIIKDEEIIGKKLDGTDIVKTKRNLVLIKA